MAKGALEKAMDLLAIRPLTGAEVRSKLQAANRYAEEEIAEAVETCCARGYLNDELLAADAARYLNSGGRGRGIIRKKLRARGVDEELVAKAVEEITPEEEYESAVAAAAGKLRLLTREKDFRKKREKLFRFLISRGFPPSLCGRVVSEELSGANSEEEPEFYDSSEESC